MKTSVVVSPSGKLLFHLDQTIYHYMNVLMVFITNTKTQDGIIVNDPKLIYMSGQTDGYTETSDIEVYWVTNEEGEDILVEHRKYEFYVHDGFLILADPCYNDISDIMIEHRYIMYKHDAHQKKKRMLQHRWNGGIEFDCEMVMVDDKQGKLFKQWKSQEMCMIYRGKEMHRREFPEQKMWTDYNYEDTYY
jgi:hypothetical protein